jgi:hypothetical protein
MNKQNSRKASPFFYHPMKQITAAEGLRERPFPSPSNPNKEAVALLRHNVVRDGWSL